LAFAVGGVGQTAIAARMLASGIRNAGVWIKLALGIADVSTTAVEEYVRGNPDTEFSRMWIENRDIIYPVLLAANLTDAVITTYINRVRQLDDAFFRETGREIGTAVARGGRIVVTSVDEVKPFLATNRNTAFFWSGTTNGVGGEARALEIARSKGGTTLEGLLKSRNIDMPAWNASNLAVVKLWEDVATQYANQVSGEVRAVIGRNLRLATVSQTKELPALKANRNVTRIIKIDPETLVETVIFVR